MIFRGLVCFPFRGKLIFVDKRTQLKCKSKISFGRSVTIGKYCSIDGLSTDGIQLGDNVSIGPNTDIICTGQLQHLGKGLVLGNSVGIGSHCLLGCAGGISIGADTIIGNYVTFHAENHQFEDTKTLIRLQGVTHQGIQIGANCWIGAKATILDGVIIEDGCVIAAGALVTAGHYVKSAIYGGVPAKMMGTRDKTKAE
jgi:acetyltransferase-like isoleucine patch superfamily enzyme